MDFLQCDAILKERHEPAFRLTQIMHAFGRDLVSRWDEVTTIPSDLRKVLAEKVPVSSLKEVRSVEAAHGDTLKIAFTLHDGQMIETVLMRHNDGRRTICVSSQAGCPMRCTFCATGTMGFKRNLTSEEIIDQVLHFARLLTPKNEKVTNVVLMGMGEPMHNYDAVISALRTLNHKDGFNLGARHMSISTCGIVPGILRLADEPMQINLAISLHAPNDTLRTKLMPVNIAYPLAKLMPAIEMYVAKTRRKVFFEYLLIDGMNDTDDVADELAKLLARPLYHVNLIKYHTTGAFVSSSKHQRFHFMEMLKARGVSVTHRITFGEDIDAACGQLANKYAQK